MTKLENMLKYVSEHNDFYKKRIKEYGITNPLDITQWPILTRRELQENRYNMFSEGYKSKYFNQQLKRQSSSGSSGMPVNVYWDYKDWYASNMSLWRKRTCLYGIKPMDKYAMFTLSAMDVPDVSGNLHYLNEPSNLISFNTSIIKNDFEYDDIVKHIEIFEPTWLYIQPYVLRKIMQSYVRMQKQPSKSIKYIESVGEVLDSDLKKQVSELFRISPTNMYGSEEMNGIAIETSPDLLEILQDNVYVEVRDSTGVHKCGNGQSIITNLNNHAMPLIRYCQDDDIAIERCGRYITLINGRFVESVDMPGANFSTILLCDSIADINNQYKDPISEYSFKYEKKRNILTVVIKLKRNTMQKVIVEELYKKILSLLSSKNNECCLSLNIQVSDTIKHIKNHVLVVGD